MKPEKQQLIDDLLGSENRREGTLLAGAKTLRRRRFWRAARPAFALTIAALAISTTIWLPEQKNRPTTLVQISAPPQVKSLTDEELLALFPNTPVGLITLHNGKKVLCFPRPGDQAKFVTRF
jgi:hypothetical protein